MIGWEEFDDWITCALIVATTILIALVAVAVLVISIYQVIYVVRRSLRRGGGKTPALSLEEVLEMIPDYFPHHQELVVPGGGGGAAGDDDDDDERESCVICVAPYERGEACSVLPECGHVFHKLCVAKWLRQKSTCPLCRAAFDVTGYARQDDYVSAAENMV